MFNPCKNCAVKGNCTTICKPYNKYQKYIAGWFSTLTIITVGIIASLLLIFYPNIAFIVWGSSIILCHIIPMTSNGTSLFESIILGPFIISIFIVATITRPYVMKPTEYSKYKKRTKFERFFGINHNKRA